MAFKNKPEAIDPSVFANPSEVALPAAGSGFVVPSVEMQQKPLPAGKYLATCKYAEGKVAATSGNPMIALRWEVEYEGRNRLVFDNLVFTAPTGDWNQDYPLRKIRQCVDVCGITPGADGSINPEDFLGCTITIEVQLKQRRNRDGSTIDPETGEDLGMQNNVAGYHAASNAPTTYKQLL